MLWINAAKAGFGMSRFALFRDSIVSVNPGVVFRSSAFALWASATFQEHPILTGINGEMAGFTLNPAGAKTVTIFSVWLDYRPT